MSETPNPLIPPPPAPPLPFSVGALTPDETTFAALAQILQTSTWWIGPLIIYFIKRESKFVSFHAMQALLWQIALVIIFVGGMLAWMIVIFAFVMPQQGHVPEDQFPWAIFVPFMFLYFGMFVVMILNFVLAILFGIKAGRGQWAEYPLLGRWARRIVGA
jgi:uncharacterized protein